MKKKVGALILAATLAVGLPASIFAGSKLLEAKALVKTQSASEANLISESKRLLSEALREKTFYKYNVAYTSIMKIQDAYERDTMLAQLATIMNIVWNDDVKKFNFMLEDLVKTKGSGKIYDEMEGTVGKSGLSEIDKAYLLGELTSWGRQLVYTTDYGIAVDRVVYAWIMLTSGTEQNLTSAITDAENAIKGVRNSYSKTYLTEQVQQIKEKSEFTIIEIQ